MGYVGSKPSAVPLTSADITDGVITSAKIADGTIVNADINASAGIDSTKISGLSSDFVKLATITASSSASVSFDGYFSSTYTNYKIIFNSVKASTAQYFRVRVRQSNADVTTSNYYGGGTINFAQFDGGGYSVAQAKYYNSNYTGGGALSYWETGYSDGSSTFMQVNTTTNTSVNGTMLIFNPLSTDNHKYIEMNICYRATGDGWNNNVTSARGFNVFQDATALSGMTFYPSTGNFVSGTFKLYGIK